MSGECQLIGSGCRSFPNDSWGVTDKRPDSDGILDGAARHDGEGFLEISDALGIGVLLKPDALKKHPYRKREIVTRLHRDGAIVDQ